ncbi:TetR/AcrR family transcriptional regulator [Marmoricola sp. URHB0036]|uniref:TetR/AcrR family transcriptional regulator n=1 Tax=Marmoricola sp. URHB0036 TaxID=1298863 RepID=UPI0003FFFC81|nr:TetR/AcrR family transcriptional regulator [Marmoricola sp. URHB0036]
MSRWEPNAPARLAQAAMELFAEAGYEETTVARIAERAGLTERTFFRHFADKREVLFAGSSELEALFVDTVAAAPESAGPMQAVAAALEQASGWFVDRRTFARARQAVISSHSALTERELTKMARLATALARALRERGVEEPAASLTAEAGVAVFRVAFERWTAPREKRPLGEIITEALGELRTITSE